MKTCIVYDKMGVPQGESTTCISTREEFENVFIKEHVEILPQKEKEDLPMWLPFIVVIIVILIFSQKP